MATATNRILWLALVVALLVYAAVPFFVAANREPAPQADLLGIVLVAVAVSTAIATLFIRARMLASPIATGEIDPRTPEGMQRAFVPFILCLVLSESVGIYGLVLSLLAANPLYALPFVGGGLALLFVHRPTARDLEPQLGGSHLHLDSTPIS